MKPFEPFSSKTEKSSIITQMENMKREIDDLKKTKQAVDSKDKKIITLEKKLRTISQERNKLKHQLSASRAGGVGGQIDTSSSGYELVNSASKNVETGGSSSSR